MEKAFQLATSNIATHGDTDVFPYPVDNAIFHDCSNDVVQLLLSIEKSPDFDATLLRYPLTSDTNLVAAGYTGFRAATQIDPLWNAYLLGAVIALGPSIEAARIPVENKMVFSYRFAPDLSANTLFDRSVGWREFQRESVLKARNAPFVVACDISDFYARIYHHRLENELQRAADANHLIPRIMDILSALSIGTSYGLPVGGHAARLLSELLLNSVDQLLFIENVSFTRFADDYFIFASSKHEAYRHLIFLSEKLQRNEGLSLQKAKTRIMTAQEFIATSEFSEESALADTEEERTARKFRSLRLYFDPYSDTAVEDYEKLKEALSEFDIVGMLQNELRKSRIHQATTRRLIGVIQHLEPDVKSAAVKTILESLEVLTPVFTSVMLLLKDIVRSSDEEVNRNVFLAIHKLFIEESPLISLPINISYCLRVLAYDNSIQATQLLASVYARSESLSLRRDIINIMTQRVNTYWLSDKRKAYSTATQWEKRALLIASYVLGDEGNHWRGEIKGSLNEYDKIIRDWASKRKQANKKGLPL